MRTKMLAISLVCVGLAVGSFVWMMMLMKKNEYVDRKDEKTCEKNNTAKEGSDCAIWDNDHCRKGKIESGLCVSKGHVLPLLLLIMGVMFSILAIVMVFYGMKR